MRQQALFIVFIFAFTASIFSQTLSVTEEQQLEENALLNDTEQSEQMEENIPITPNKYDVNSITAEELEQLKILNALQIEQLLNYRKRFGKILSLYELQYLPGWKQETIALLLPHLFIDYQKPTSPNYFSQHLTLRFQQTLQNEKGYVQDNGYLGSKQRYLIRSTTKTNYFTCGVLAEKDAGETLFNTTNKQGFDLYSGYIQTQTKNKKHKIIVGDYNITSGQGLLLWSGYAGGKSAQIFSVKKNAQYITPKRSISEYYFFRGVGIENKFKTVSSHLFYSSKQIDGNVTSVDTVTGEPNQISSIKTDGYHNTTSLTAEEKNVTETLIGGIVRHQYKSLKTMITGYHLQYSAPLIPQDKLYTLFSFKGTKQHAGSISFDYTTRNISLFNETAITSKNKTAFLQGVLINLTPSIGLSAVYRNYEAGYYSPYASGLGDSYNTSNEKGLFTGLEINTLKKLSLQYYHDLYKRPWLTYTTNGPSYGSEHVLNFNYFISDRKKIYGTIKIKNEDDISITSYRTRYIHEINENVQSSTHIILTQRTLSDANTSGYCFAQDVTYKRKDAYTTFLRLAYFDTDTYDDRIYIYERDLPTLFYTPAMYYTGYRISWGINMRIKLSYQLGLKFNHTHYLNRTSIGSALYEIDGKNKTEVKAQLIIRF